MQIKRMINKIIFIIITIISFTTSATACSSIWINYGKYFIMGANLDGEGDWDGLIFINYRNVSKQTDLYNNGKQDKHWISKYGSITFNLVCKEYAQYGMNEQGLVVSTVSNPETKGPEPDDRPSMIGNFWVQYILDVCENVEQVKQTLKEIRIIPGIDRYIICDKYNQSMVIEFRNHKVKIYENESLPIHVVTNQSYSNCLAHYNNQTLPQINNIFDYITTKRFVTAAKDIANLKCLDPKEGIKILFDTLLKIQGSPESLWRLVFDQSEMKIYFITKENKKRRYLDVTHLDFQCRNNHKMMDIDLDVSGDISNKFIDYSSKKNFRLYKSTMKNIGKKTDDKEIKAHIKFLEGFNCN